MTTKLTHTGLLFGSFNPIHIGHLALANYILEYSYLDEIWFIVSPQNPFKESASLEDEDKRLQMVEMAIKEEPRFKACDIEFSLPKPSYTINTLEKLTKEYPDRIFSIIMGSDNLIDIEKWKKSDEIVSSFPLIVYPRPGYPIKKQISATKIEIIEAPLFDISSTIIRKAFDDGKKLRYLLPDGVFQYISDHKLYGTNRL